MIQFGSGCGDNSEPSCDQISRSLLAESNSKRRLYFNHNKYVIYDMCQLWIRIRLADTQSQVANFLAPVITYHVKKHGLKSFSNMEYGHKYKK